VQLVFAGKAHPRDNGGKELIARVVHMSMKPEFRRRVVFIEDYDMNVARYLVQGVDVWLNNPRRPLEASGTSGMKVAANGGLNLSILDGWWVEGYDGDNGWAIGAGEEYTDLTYQDTVESRSLYELLERDIAPTFYDRGPDGLPRNWVRRMKRSLATIVPVFNTNRMVAEYLARCYRPSHQRHENLSARGYQEADDLAAWRKRVGQQWNKVRVEGVEAPTGESLRVGATFPVKVHVALGELTPGDVEVQLCHGLLDSFGEIAHPQALALAPQPPNGTATVTYSGQVPCRASGQFGFSVRVLPRHARLPHLFEPGLVTWG
jgi:starch phosphorylase